MEKPRTILVVENDSGVRRLIRDKLPKYLPGYELLEAESGVQALSRADQHAGQIDIVVADSVVGDLTTAHMSHLLRTRYPRVKFIYMFECGEDSESVGNGEALVAG